VAFLSIEEATAARSLQLPSGEGLLRNGDVLYAWGGGGLTVLSLVSSLEPAVLTTLQDGSFFNASRNDDLLLVVGRDLTVIYSIAAPDQPRKLSSWSSDESRLVFSCAAAGTIFYQGEFTHPFRSDQVGLRLFDFSEPTQLQPIGFLELPDPPYHLRVLGNRLVGSGDSVALWNITSPREPRPLAAMARKFEGPAVGRVAVVDGERLVTNGVVFDLAGDNLDALERFDPKFTQVDGFPHGGVASGDKIFLPQWQRILVLRRVR
jgi:hypothetical protein